VRRYKERRTSDSRLSNPIMRPPAKSGSAAGSGVAVTSANTCIPQSPHRYVSAKRLERAKALMIQGDRSLVDIALALSFSCQANSHGHLAMRRDRLPPPLLFHVYRDKRIKLGTVLAGSRFLNAR